MAVTSWVTAESAQILGNVTGLGGSVNWTNPGNAAADDGSNATVVLSTDEISRRLQATFNNAGGTLSKFADESGHSSSFIPSGNVLIGVELEIQRSLTAGSGDEIQEINTRFLSGATAIGDFLTAQGTGGADWSVTSMWGGPSSALGLTATNLRTIDFRVQTTVAEAVFGSGGTAAVDVIRVRAYHTDGPYLTGAEVESDGSTLKLTFSKAVSSIGVGSLTIALNNTGGRLYRDLSFNEAQATFDGTVVRLPILTAAGSVATQIGDGEADLLFSAAEGKFVGADATVSPQYANYTVTNNSTQRNIIWVDFENGDATTSSGGDSSMPYNGPGLEAALSAISGLLTTTTVYCKNQQFGDALKLNGISDFEMIPWPSASAIGTLTRTTAAIISACAGLSRSSPSSLPIYWSIRSDVALANASFTLNAGSVYYITGVTADPECVSEDWNPFDAQPKGWLTKGSSATLNAGEWWWDTGTNRLYIRASDSSNITSNGKRYARHVRGEDGGSTPEGGVFIISAGTIDNLTVRGGLSAGWTGTVNTSGETADQAYGIFVQAATSSTIDGCAAVDCGFHAIGFVGNVCQNNTISGCLAKGAACNTGGHSQYIAYGGLTSSATTLSCTYSDCVSHQYVMLRPDGTTRLGSGTYGVAAFHAHCASSVNHVVDDHLVQGCYASGISGITSRIYDSTDRQTAVSNENDWTDYPIRIVGGTFVNQSYWGAIGSLADQEKRIAWVRCLMEFPYFKDGSLGGMCYGLAPSSTYLFESCIIDGDCTGLAGLTGRMFYGRGGSEKFIVRGCTCISRGDNASDSFLYRHDTTNRFVARGSIFYRSGTACTLHTGEAGTTGVAHGVGEPVDVLGCAYSGITATGYSNNGTYNTAAEWGAMDTLGVFSGVTFVDIDSYDYNLDGQFKSTRAKLPALAGLIGINGGGYTGNFGAFQYSAVQLHTRSRDAAVRPRAEA